MSKPRIEFAVEDFQRSEIELYARAKGFARSSDLARYALVQHMKRYPLSAAEALKYGINHGTTPADARAVQPDALEAT
jgi:hypothetical protein